MVKEIYELFYVRISVSIHVRNIYGSKMLYFFSVWTLNLHIENSAKIMRLDVRHTEQTNDQKKNELFFWWLGKFAYFYWDK